MNIALFGGSFDPPHLAHQVACFVLLEAEGFDRVWLVPTARHAFGKRLSEFDDRLAMCALAARPFGGRVVVSELERNLAGDVVANRTVDTLDYVRAHYPEDVFSLVIGSDLVTELPSWKDFDRLRTLAPILVLRRPGDWTVDEATWRVSKLGLPEISSSEIRNRCQAGLAVRGLVSLPVADYIERHGLYRAS